MSNAVSTPGHILSERTMLRATYDLMPFDGPIVARATVEKDDWMDFYVNMYLSSICVPVPASELPSVL